MTPLHTKVRMMILRRRRVLISFSGLDLDKDTMVTVYNKFGLEPGTQDFIGHAMALYLTDE